MKTQPEQPAESKATEELARLVHSHAPAAVELRRELHQIPELMFEERRTSQRVAAELQAIGVEHATGLAKGTGLLGFLPATADNHRDAPTVALRADMDALPITENSGKPYASKNPGLMHACGHDGHTATLVATANVLAHSTHRPNNTIFIFQPAEEGGAGAEKMCNDGALDGSAIGTPATIVYGLHGWPELRAGHVASRPGPLLAATDEFILTIRGRGCHAAYPHFGIDPIATAAQLINALQTIASRRTNPTDPVVVTVGAIHGGTTFNVIPDTVELKGTIRTLNETTRAHVQDEFRLITSQTCEAMGAHADIHWIPGYPATHNDQAATDRFFKVANNTLGAERVALKPGPTMGGEDFSYYGQHAPACFFLLGLKPDGWHTYPNLHTPEFDFNDDAIPAGMHTLAALALEPIDHP